MGLTLKSGSKEPLVQTLKQWLNVALSPSPGLDASDEFDKKTQSAVIKVQSSAGLSANGVVTPRVWSVIGQKVRARSVATAESLGGDSPRWLRNLLKDIETVPVYQFDRAGFLERYAAEFGPLNSSAGKGAPKDATPQKGLEFLLQSLEQDIFVTDIRWAAYMLATVKHECADTWQPIEEYGKGKGRPYGTAVSVTDPATKKVYSNAYYGRGFVQLTWKANYTKMDKDLGLQNELVLHPEKVLDPTLAYRVMSYGMRYGKFTGVGLSKFIQGTKVDYGKARQIINGMDVWQLIKGHAEKLEAVLVSSANA
jgi:hypothetical protein